MLYKSVEHHLLHTQLVFSLPMLEIIINNQSQICDSVAHDNHVIKKKTGGC